MISLEEGRGHLGRVLAPPVLGVKARFGGKIKPPQEQATGILLSVSNLDTQSNRSASPSGNKRVKIDENVNDTMSNSSNGGASNLGVAAAASGGGEKRFMQRTLSFRQKEFGSGSPQNKWHNGLRDASNKQPDTVAELTNKLAELRETLAPSPQPPLTHSILKKATLLGAGGGLDS